MIHFNESKVSGKKYEQLRTIYEKSESEDKSQQLAEINEDYVGWLSVDGTDIQYPVVLGQDNDFYLTHNFYKEEDRAGAIFMDYRNSGDHLDFHTIIYGHNMKDKSMFANLGEVLDGKFSKANHIRFEFKNQTYEWEIFSAYITRETDWMDVDFKSDHDSENFIQSITNKSSRAFSNEFAENNQIITLATCTNFATDERVVVHAKLIKGNE